MLPPLASYCKLPSKLQPKSPQSNLQLRGVRLANTWTLCSVMQYDGAYCNGTQAQLVGTWPAVGWNAFKSLLVLQSSECIVI